MRPTASCCCCVPWCCDLRTGVLFLSVAQVCFGLLYGAYFISKAVGAALDRLHGALPGALQPAPAPSLQPLVSMASLFLTSAWLLATGAMGLLATHSPDDLRALKAEKITRATAYWKMNLCLCVFRIVASVPSGALTTSELALVGRGSSGGVLGLVLVYWALTAVEIGAHWYFTLVAWSYKSILLQARSGELETDFVLGPAVLEAGRAGRGARTAPGVCEMESLLMMGSGRVMSSAPLASLSESETRESAKRPSGCHFREGSSSDSSGSDDSWDSPESLNSIWL